MLLSLTLDKNNYITSFCTGGIASDETLHFETDYIPEDFYECYRAYHLDKDNSLVLDTSKLIDVSAENEINDIRALRQIECFSVADRGKLWYDGLTDAQYKELNEWYQAWLDVTESKTKSGGFKIPERPKWLV